MAFNPFEIFRKRQKVLLACLAIVAMFLFVIGDAVSMRQGGDSSFGGGLRRLFGSDENRIAKVDGKSIDPETLKTLSLQRRSAMELVSAVQQAGEMAIYREAGFTTEQAFYARLLQAGFLNEAQLSDDAQRRQVSEVRRKLDETRRTRPEVFRPLEQGTDSLCAQVGSNPHPDDPQGLVDFLIWQQKADELGVVFTADRVKADLFQAGFNRVSEGDLPQLIQQHKISGDTDTILDSLRHELRVMIARGAVLGLQPAQRFRGMTFFAPPPVSAQATPLDLWEAYRRVKGRLEVGILPIPVNRKDFIAQVPEPTDQELKEYFAKIDEATKLPYKEQEPDPARQTPGFKIPKLYKVEFIYADLRSNNYYRQWARVIEELNPQAFFQEILAFYQEHRERRYRVVSPVALLVSGKKFEEAGYYRVPLPTDVESWSTASSVEQQSAARYAAAVAGLLAGTPPTSLGLTSVLRPGGEKANPTAPLAREIAGAVAGAGLGLPGLLAYPPRLGYTEHYRPLSEVAGAIADELNENRRRNLLEADLTTLEKNLSEYSKVYTKEYAKWERAAMQARKKDQPVPAFKPPDFVEKTEPGQKASDAKPDKVATTEKQKDKETPKGMPINDYLKNFAKTRGLIYEGTTELRPRDETFKEQEKTPLGTILRPLFRDLEETARKRFPGSFDEKEFNESVLRALLDEPKNAYEAQRARAPSGPPPAPRFGQPDEKQWVYAVHWKSEEASARVPPFQEAAPKVREAWKLEKARQFAEKYAEELVQKVKAAKPDVSSVVKDLEGYQSDKTLARYELAKPITATDPVDYRPAEIPVIEHPEDGLLDQVFSTLQEPGDAIALTNKPKSHYYIIVLKERNEPRANDPVWVARFDQEVILPDPSHQLQIGRTQLYRFVQREQGNTFVEEWEKSLRTHARYDDAKGKELSEELKRRRENDR